MSIHKLTAGSGYDYLTRQVAAHDVTDKGHTGLASYYTAQGESPGRWVGSGMAGIDGLDVGDEVTAQQMRALFGSGHHPLAAERAARLEGPALSVEDVRVVTRLGAPFKVFDGDATAFQVEVATRIAALTTGSGAAVGGAEPGPSGQVSGRVSLEDRARVRTQVAVEYFRTEYGRDPVDAREVAATIAKNTRPRTTAVAGYDLTFSPVKSVSALWAVADPATAATIEQAHHAAVADALAFLEQHALFTRVGTNGVRQVEVRGLVGAAFTHRDSRAGDPDLHTHVAVANKVQTLQPADPDGGAADGPGRWLAIDGRLLFQATVAASETYNTALERHLHHDLGLRFETRADRPGQPASGESRKHPVREVVGVESRLNQVWSSRRTAIEARQGDLARTFHTAHGRPPTPVEAIQLAQQATLETRVPKKHPRSPAQQRRSWRDQAAHVLGSERAIEQMVRAALHPPPTPATSGPGTARVDTAWVHQTAAGVTSAVEARRSTWQVWHVRAEAHRHLRAAPGLDLTPTQTERVVDLLVDAVLDQHSIALSAPGDEAAGIREPGPLRRRDGSSVYTVAGAERFTSARILAAEARLLATAGRLDGRTATTSDVDLALIEATANGVTLNPGQADLVHQMATSGSRLQLAIAPAGSGKTTALHALATAWTTSGGTVIGLAPSAAAAVVLSDHIRLPTSALMGSPPSGEPTETDTLAKLVWSITQLDHGDARGYLTPATRTSVVPAWVTRIGPDTLVVIDEAGMADTLSLDTAVAFVTARGGSVRLIGDDQQLAAIGAGGVLRDLDTTYGALRLDQLLRFTTPAEGAASLALRDGRPEALGFYLDHARVHVGDPTTVIDDILTAWAADRADGLDALMLAPTRDLVADLNHRARTHRLTHEVSTAGAHPAGVSAQQSPPREVRLADGNTASAGDLVITRTNNRRLTAGGAGSAGGTGRRGGSNWVKNGDRWTIQHVGDDGALTVRHHRHGHLVTLPPEYVAGSVELGYATTIHAAQGVTADTVHGLVTGHESRQQLYTMLTRGRHANHVHVQIVSDGDPHTTIHPATLAPPTATDILEAILARDDTPTSATTQQSEQAEPAHLLGRAVARYTDAVHAAAEHHHGHNKTAALEHAADQIGTDGITVDPDNPADRHIPSVRLTEQPAWPTLRAHLLLLAAHGIDPVTALRHAAARHDLRTADDPAAVIDWRLPPPPDPDRPSPTPWTTRPLPWMASIPPNLAQHPTWGPYLTRRADLVRDLATQVKATAGTSDTPAWGRADGVPLEPALLGDLAVWRATMAVAENDHRPTGPAHRDKNAAHWQHHLDARVMDARHHDQNIRSSGSARSRDWTAILRGLHSPTPGMLTDDFTPQLARHLADMGCAGLETTAHLAEAVGCGPLPDDHAAAALWWRIQDQLTLAEKDLLSTAQPMSELPHHPDAALDEGHHHRARSAEAVQGPTSGTAHDRRRLPNTHRDTPISPTR